MYHLSKNHFKRTDILIIADCHNDTPYRLFFEKGNLLKNNFNIDIKKQGIHKTLLFYAIFMDYERYGDNPRSYFLDIYKNMKKEFDKNKKHTKPFKSSEDFLLSDKKNYIITLEGGDFIESENDIDFLHSLMIKAITLTWNKSNKIASCHLEKNDNGLSDFGKKIIKKMEEKNIIPDLSHSSDRTFFDVLEVYEKPVLVSHSNSRKICRNSRNITDDMFLRLIKNKGVCGINFYRDFVGKNGDIDSLCDHIFHFLSLGGENNIAFGSDFDGASPLIKEINDFSDFKKIINRLLQLNLNEEILKKIMYENILKILL